MSNRSLPQHRRFQAPREHKKVRSETSRRDAQNAQAAAIILADPGKHGGEQAGLVRWARLFVARAESPDVQSSSQNQDRQTVLFEHAQYREYPK